MQSRSRKKLGQIKMEFTPMIDVVFLLLIFFMCTLKFKTLEGKLSAYLPKDVGVNTSQAEPIEKVEIMLQVIEEGTKYRADSPDTVLWNGTDKRFVYGSDRRIRYTVGAMRTFDLKELGTRIETMLKLGGEKRPATIDPRKGIVYADVTKVLDVVISAKYDEVTFVGSYEKQ